MKKRYTVFALGLIGFLLGFALRNLPIHFCSEPYQWGSEVACLDKLPINLGDSLFAFSVMIIFFSLLTYKLRDEIFRAWFRFTSVWVPLSVVAILLADDSPNRLFVSEQEFVAMLVWGLYALLSTGIIIWKYVSLRAVKVR